MRVGVYFCRCGGIITDKIDEAETRRELEHDEAGRAGYFKGLDLGCGDDGLAELVADLEAERPDRVVILACSPREHEDTFRRALARAGMNPFLLQLVNVREHVAWVTEDASQATGKAVRLARAAIRRSRLQEALDAAEIEVDPSTLVVGGGPAGLKAALTLAEAGRRVVLVEAGPILGGMPVLYDEMFPKMECGPCVLEPFLADVLHGPHASKIEVHLLTEVASVAGSFGNFSITLRKSARYVDLQLCVGCGACTEPCPVSYPNSVNSGWSSRKAIDFAFFGGLPNAPFVDRDRCLRTSGKDSSCELCRAACPVEGAVRLDDADQVVETSVGAALLAVGGATYDMGRLPNLGYGLPGVLTSLEFERLLAGTGPTSGRIQLADGRTPERIAIVHCAGSLDAEHNPYCSGVCCLSAFKFSNRCSHQLPGVQIAHYFKTLVMPGKDEFELHEQVRARPTVRFSPYRRVSDLAVAQNERGALALRHEGAVEDYDMVVLMPAVVLSERTRALAKMFDVGVDRCGFLEELHGRVDATRSKSRGVYLAGACQAPMDLGRAMTQGLAAAGAMLAELVPGRKLRLEPAHAVVDADRCSGCRSCLAVCPYKAISFDAGEGVAGVNPARCVGCGTCVAACPSGVMEAKHFSNEQIMAEIEGILS